MNLRIERGEIALPKDFRFDITANHPFFSTDGSASTPVTIPGTPENRRLLAFPENINRAKVYSRQLPAILSHGIFFKPCRMVIDSASASGGITTSLALEESEMYAAVQDKKLREIITPQTLRLTIPMDSDIQTELTKMYTYSTYDIAFFPVAADAEDTDTADSTGSKRVPGLILNKVLGSGKLRTEGVTIDHGDSGTVTAPEFYGLAPFLRLHTLLDMIFTNLGYTVTENVFATNIHLKTIVVLHNTADTMTAHVSKMDPSHPTFLIHYEDMVPSMTVGDVIQWLRDKFGAFVTMQGGNVQIRLFADVAAQTYDADLSPYLREDPSVTYPAPLMLRVGCEHSIESSEPAADTIEKLRAGYSSMVECFQVSDAVGTGLFYVRPLGKYYYRNSAGDPLSMVGTDGFDYYREMDRKTEECISEDNFVPMIQVDGEYLPYIGNSIRRHIDIDDKDAEAEQPMQICYMGNYGAGNYGTLYDYTPAGGSAGTSRPPLTPEGLMASYFAAWRDILLSGAPTITANLDIPLNVITSIDLWTPKLFCGAKVFIKSLKYSISDAGISTCEVTMQTFPEYVDKPVAQEPPAFSSNLVWEYVNTRTVYDSGDHKNGTEVTGGDGLTDYTMADAPDYIPRYPGIIEKRRTRYLDYVRYEHSSGGWFLWHWSSQSSQKIRHGYEEYFISKNRQ